MEQAESGRISSGKMRALKTPGDHNSVKKENLWTRDKTCARKKHFRPRARHGSRRVSKFAYFQTISKLCNTH